MGDPAERDNLRAKLGLGSAASLVIANMIGAGIFTTSGLVIGQLGSPGLMMTLWVTLESDTMFLLGSIFLTLHAVTLLMISFLIFALLDLAPGDPTGSLPRGIPAETRIQLRKALGLDDPFLIRYAKWMRQFFINEPISFVESLLEIEIGNSAEPMAVP